MIQEPPSLTGVVRSVQRYEDGSLGVMCATSDSGAWSYPVAAHYECDPQPGQAIKVWQSKNSLRGLAIEDNVVFYSSQEEVDARLAQRDAMRIDQGRRATRLARTLDPLNIAAHDQPDITGRVVGYDPGDERNEASVDLEAPNGRRWMVMVYSREHRIDLVPPAKGEPVLVWLDHNNGEVVTSEDDAVLVAGARGVSFGDTFLFYKSQEQFTADERALPTRREIFQPSPLSKSLEADIASGRDAGPSLSM